ncbi:hypothetical protein LTS10_010312 [Elasticomyces elasticus]|nr:hypothetical protein LTS10_010312 [Elasticomyces elasticus]
MKIILTGSTGFIGSALLARCLSLPTITSIVVLSRRPLPSPPPDPRNILSVVLQPDFLTYPPEMLSQLEGAEACIWCLGTPTSGKEVHVDYTLAAATAFARNLAPKVGDGERFTFVHLSGKLCERDQSQSLWFMEEARKMRGGVETSLVELEAVHKGVWRSMSARPGGVSKAGVYHGIMDVLVPSWTIGVEELAAGMIDLAVSGEGAHFVENDQLKERGRKALQTAS